MADLGSLLERPVYENRNLPQGAVFEFAGGLHVWDLNRFWIWVLAGIAKMECERHLADLVAELRADYGLALE